MPPLEALRLGALRRVAAILCSSAAERLGNAVGAASANVTETAYDSWPEEKWQQWHEWWRPLYFSGPLSDTDVF